MIHLDIQTLMGLEVLWSITIVGQCWVVVRYNCVLPRAAFKLFQSILAETRKELFFICL